jgi:hypothetical protein
MHPTSGACADVANHRGGTRLGTLRGRPADTDLADMTTSRHHTSYREPALDSRARPQRSARPSAPAFAALAAAVLLAFAGASTHTPPLPAHHAPAAGHVAPRR